MAPARFISSRTIALHLAQHAQAQRHPGVDPASQPLDHSGAQHQLVADHLSVGRRLLERRQEKTGSAHENPLKKEGNGDFTRQMANRRRQLRTQAQATTAGEQVTSASASGEFGWASRLSRAGL
jgi:hypothetical protein